MSFRNKILSKLKVILIAFAVLVSACSPTDKPVYLLPENDPVEEILATSTPFPTRPVYEPGTLVDYVAQSGDTLKSLAARFNTSVEEIREANPIIPDDATTMPPGMPMQIPIYYRSLWGTDYQIIPDSAFVNGPDSIDFDIGEFLTNTSGWFKNYTTYTSNGRLNAAGVIDWVSINFSVSPQLLIALVEYQTGALTNPIRDTDAEKSFMGFDIEKNKGVYMQISYVANMLNDYYYRYRRGEITGFEHIDGRLENIDPWQNAGTAALHLYFSRFLDGEQFLRAIGPDGFIHVYKNLFGDPWVEAYPHIPGSLVQPDFVLPFEPGTTWAYTGGPHTGWGNLAPWSAIDFAPPVGTSGCVETDEYATAVAAGIVARTDPGIVVLDLDGDGDERTGWVVFYLHIATKDRVLVGTILNTGDRIGHPSCEGGTSSGTHIHIARKFNGEWIEADSIIPFKLSGWVAKAGTDPYSGTLVKDGKLVIANINPGSASMISSEN